MSLRKVSTRASAKRVRSSKSLVLFSLKICSELLPRMLHRKLSQAWSHLKVALEFSHRLRTFVRKTIFSQDNRPLRATLPRAKILTQQVDTTILMLSKIVPEVLQAATCQTQEMDRPKICTTKVKCQSKDWRAPRWTSVSREASLEKAKMMAPIANMMRWTTSTMGTRDT